MGDTATKLASVREQVGKAIRGKNEIVDLVLTAILARGHILLQDVPGVGKTTLGRAIAAAMGGSFRRLQFTSDMLPADILGVTVYSKATESFVFHEGPVFANFLLADEINRTPPRTQSALLEAMSERHVTIDGEPRDLPKPFVVIATQNPVEQYGTYPLPESQMDRFAMRLSMGYPDPATEAKLMQVGSRHEKLEVAQVITPEEVVAMQEEVLAVRIEESVAKYASQIVQATRNMASISIGVSTRGALVWRSVSQARAVLDGRDYCLPDDFKKTAVACLAHRLVFADDGSQPGDSAAQLISRCIENTAVPS